MSHPTDRDHEEDIEADGHLSEEDIVEVHDDSGDEPMEDDDDNAAYDGEIIIGGAGPGEDDTEMMGEEGNGVQDNSWGAQGELTCLASESAKV